jgi:hypothetical protein
MFRKWIKLYWESKSVVYVEETVAYSLILVYNIKHQSVTYCYGHDSPKEQSHYQCRPNHFEQHTMRICRIQPKKNIPMKWIYFIKYILHKPHRCTHTGSSSKIDRISTVVRMYMHALEVTNMKIRSSRITLSITIAHR